MNLNDVLSPRFHNEMQRMTNGDKVMKVLADIGGFTVIRPEMREYVSLSCLFFRPTPNACRCCCC